jgi:hypothetical protein
MRVEVNEQFVEVRLSLWERILGLLGNITIARSQVTGVEVVEDGVRAAMGQGIKVGLRIPWVRYAARTIALDRAFIVRRGVPALAISIDGEGRLREVIVSTPEAAELARRLRR